MLLWYTARRRSFAKLGPLTQKGRDCLLNWHSFLFPLRFRALKGKEIMRTSFSTSNKGNSLSLVSKGTRSHLKSKRRLKKSILIKP